MRFGGKRPAARLLVARSVVYLQAGLLAISDGWALLATFASGGPGGSLHLTGLFDRQSVAGSGVLVVALVQLLIAAGLVFLDREAAADPDSHRGMMSVVQVGYAVYLVGFLSGSASGWLFGPLLTAIVLALHWWPELGGAVLGSYPNPAAATSAADGGAGPTGVASMAPGVPAAGGGVLDQASPIPPQGAVSKPAAAPAVAPAAPLGDRSAR